MAPYLLLASFEGLERLGKCGSELLLLDGLPGPFPLLFEAGGLGRILAEDEITAQGGDSGHQRLLTRLIPLQGWQRLLQQRCLDLADPAELVIDKAGG